MNNSLQVCLWSHTHPSIGGLACHARGQNRFYADGMLVLLYLLIPFYQLHVFSPGSPVGI